MKLGTIVVYGDNSNHANFGEIPTVRSRDIPTESSHAKSYKMRSSAPISEN